MDRRWLIVPLASSLMLALANSVSGRPSTDDSVQRQGAAGHFLFPIGGRQFSQIKIRKTTTTTTKTTTNAVASKSVLKLQDDRTTKELGRKLGQKKKRISLDSIKTIINFRNRIPPLHNANVWWCGAVSISGPLDRSDFLSETRIGATRRLKQKKIFRRIKIGVIREKKPGSR